jgi:hypothetical protein
MNVPTTYQQKKPDRVKVETILTIYSKALLTPERNLDAQNEAIARFSNKAGDVIVAGNIRPPCVKEEDKTSGFLFLGSKDENPSLVEILSYYRNKAKGGPDGVVIIAAPNIDISKDQSKLFAFVDAAKMQRAWAGGLKCPTTLGNNPPDAFVMQGYIIEFILKDVPGDLNFTTNAWASWLDLWFKRHMQPNRYFDGSSLGLVNAFENVSATYQAEDAAGSNGGVFVPPQVKVLPALPLVEFKAPAASPKRHRGRPAKVTQEAI